MNLKKLIDYFTQNQEDSDNVRSISISMDAMSIRKATGNSEEADPTEEPKEKKAEEGTEGQVG
jgi:hypothetical protein